MIPRWATIKRDSSVYRRMPIRFSALASGETHGIMATKPITRNNHCFLLRFIFSPHTTCSSGLFAIIIRMLFLSIFSVIGIVRGNLKGVVSASQAPVTGGR
jgi:hypothetical protein